MNRSFNKPEILAPVGGSEQLLAAVRSGADAVYFGLQNFNARRNAENFAGEGLKDTIAYCRARNVKVYITINILVKDSELSEMQKAVDTAAEAGADAIIVQDLAVARYIRTRWPKLPMFASTQMVCHNAEGVRELQKLGFRRVVLARELSLKEIKSVIEETGAETEVFVHGAHCMSVSGACYMSAMIGGRSGNRGLCAQPCRLDWQLNGRDHALSLKDLSYVEHMRELADAGVTSFKIEGRMKRAEYVAAAVTACRQGLAGEKPDMETLRSVFSRSGFTDGHLTGKRGPSMFGYRTKEDVTAAAGVFKDLQKLYEKERQSIPVDMELSVRKDEAVLTVSDGANTIFRTSDAVQQARNLPIDEAYARKSLAKTGGTQYVLGSLSFSTEEGLMMPASALNELRRGAIEELDKMRSQIPDYGEGGNPCGDMLRDLPKASEKPVHPFRCRLENASALKDKSSPDGFMSLTEGMGVILPVSAIEKEPRLIEKYGDALFAEIPACLWPGRGREIKERLAALKEKGLSRVTADNIGAIEIGRELGLKVHGGFCLNILNSVSLDEYKALGLEDACLSMELTYSRLRDIRPSVPVGAVVYGRLPLMKLRACPARGEKGCGSCRGYNELKDRKGEYFPLVCREREYSEILNCLPQYTADKSLPENCFRLLWFTIESSEECRYVMELCRRGEYPDMTRTAGLTQRDIE